MNIFHNDNTIHIDHVAIRVMDLEKSINFYNLVLGFEVINRIGDIVEMGVNKSVLLILKQAKTPKQKRAAGLYHIAYLVPNRKDLANWLYFHIQNKTRFDGASNHGVSEAIYLRDIDGNGIEVYTDTPKDTWSWDNNQVQMITEALDIDDLFTQVTTPTNALPNNTIIGHIHLSVLNIEESQKFYHILGFDTVLNMGNAAFLSSQKYHHHLGMNVWGMASASPHIETQADLDYLVIQYPNEEAITNVLNNLNKNGFEYIKENDVVQLIDINGIKIYLIYRK